MQSEEKQTSTFTLFMKKDKKAGEVTVQWQYVWNEPDVEPEKRDVEAHPLNKKCMVELTVIEASFLKDADTFGKQDPYIVFKYGRGTKSTTVAEDAGKHAVFNEKFTLSNINREVEKEATLVLEAMEKDIASSDLLGTTAPLNWCDLCSFEGLLKHNMDIFDKDGQKAGNVAFTTQLFWEEYIPPEASSILDEKTLLRIVIKEATFKKDADTFGK